MQMILAIAAGGASGAVLRHYMNNYIVYLIGREGFPWGIFTINVLGSFVMGLLLALFTYIWEPPMITKAFLTVGLLGAFTTFSTFSMDSFYLIQKGAYLPALLYIGGSVMLGLLAFFGGLMLGRLFA